jgi:hypothetical protein
LVELIESDEVDAADRLWRAHLADAAQHVLDHTDRRTALEVMN